MYLMAAKGKLCNEMLFVKPSGFLVSTLCWLEVMNLFKMELH